jgi:hypothetical protein
MNVPAHTVIATPNPTIAQTGGAASISLLLGYGASLLAAKYKVPIEIIGAGLTTLATIGTTIWHRFFGPAIPVQK